MEQNSKFRKAFCPTYYFHLLLVFKEYLAYWSYDESYGEENITLKEGAKITINMEILLRILYFPLGPYCILMTKENPNNQENTTKRIQRTVLDVTGRYQ